MTARLLGMLQEHWVVIEGERAFSHPGVGLLDMPLAELLNLVYYWATRHGDEAAIRKFDARLYRPPPGVVPTEGPWTVEAETAAFRGFARQVRGESPPETSGAGSGQPRKPPAITRGSAPR